ncbi:hypothetical protein [Achromobacter phage Motura]|uniref:Uncharacterized protein n=1 Tax=Achromobacter phage Motura TaxID=2591403 RepID=A0A514CT88_9CAUD|nr:hypothetical protein H1O15_gp090 [Achromobacter phage Motura]QDH83660.1 hypothetical protein [Achromobacter phage Motura]
MRHADLQAPTLFKSTVQQMKTLTRPYHVVDQLKTLQECGEYLLAMSEHNDLDAMERALGDVYSVIKRLREGPTNALEFQKESGNDLTWTACTAFGDHTNVEVVPIYMGPGAGYVLAHPQRLRYADTKQLVYHNRERLRRYFLYTPPSMFQSLTNTTTSTSIFKGPGGPNV